MRPAVLLLIIPVLLSGCATAPVDDGLIHVVTSTNTYGSIVDAVGGDLVDVTSIVSDPAQDPHSVEASARIQLALSRADLVVENGGGYDDYVDTLLAGVNTTDVPLINVTKLSGYDTSGNFNEHLFYDLPTMITVVDRIEAELAAAAPDSTETFSANAAALTEQLVAVQSRTQALSAQWKGIGVAITEPVPLYLLSALGLVNVTPPDFSEAVEEGTDVPALVLQQTLGLFADGSARVLVYNEQTESAQTEQVKAAAVAADVPVVGVTETLPSSSMSYVDWLTAEVDAIEKALES
jgi:zinc/manganese transport system substrate-binding protein